MITSLQVTVGIPGLASSSLITDQGSFGELHSNHGLVRRDPSPANDIVVLLGRDLERLLARLSGCRSQAVGSNLGNLEGLETNLMFATSSITELNFTSEVAKLTQAQLLAESGAGAVQSPIKHLGKCSHFPNQLANWRGDV